MAAVVMPDVAPQRDRRATLVRVVVAHWNHISVWSRRTGASRNQIKQMRSKTVIQFGQDPHSSGQSSPQGQSTPQSMGAYCQKVHKYIRSPKAPGLVLHAYQLHINHRNHSTKKLFSQRLLPKSYSNIAFFSIESSAFNFNLINFNFLGARCAQCERGIPQFQLHQVQNLIFLTSTITFSEQNRILSKKRFTHILWRPHTQSYFLFFRLHPIEVGVHLRWQEGFPS